MSIRALQALARRHPVLSGVVLYALVVACITRGPIATEQHRWWAGLGPVLPHDSFPADCTLCHAGSSWNELVPAFEFDHELELVGTGCRYMGQEEGERYVRSAYMKDGKPLPGLVLFRIKAESWLSFDPRKG